MDETYIVIGYQYGKFKTDEGSMRDYANLFCLQSFKGEANERYSFDGQKAFTFKCVNAEVLKNAEIGAEARLYFNNYSKVSMIVLV